MKNRRRRIVSRQCDYESLEQRNLLATFLVNTVADGDFTTPDGQLSLREALVAASTNTAVGDAQAGDLERDVIRFDSALSGQTISLTLGQLSISGDLAIFGGDNQIVIDANSNSRIFDVATTERVVVRDLTLRNGNSDSGGAIRTTGIGTTVLNNLEFVSNTARANGGGAVATANGSLNILNSRFTSNTATGPNGIGGAVLVSSAEVFVDNSTFVQNVADNSGGAFELAGGALTIFNSTLGGGDEADGNRAGNGAAVRNSGTAGTSLDVLDSLIGNNVATAEGGGVWTQAGSTTFIRGTVISENIAQGDLEDNGGGGLFNNGGTLRLRNSTITQNSANGLLGGGGGVFSADGLLSVIDSSISENEASRGGGGIEIFGGQLFVRGTTIESNLAQFAGRFSDSVDVDTGNGGGIHVSSSNASIFIRNAMIANNTAAFDGGGIWNQAGSTFRLVESQVSNNVAIGEGIFTMTDGGRGGGIFNNGGTFFVRDTAIDSNQARGAFGFGGGIRAIGAEGRVTIRTSTITGNQANVFGGGIAVSGGRLNLLDSVIGGETDEEQNSVRRVYLEGDDDIGDDVTLDAFGGGLGVESADVLIRGGEIRNNTAATEGGGVWVGRNGSLAINGATIADNQRSGIVNYEGEIFIQNSRVIGNSSTRGGGLRLRDGFVGVVDSVFSDNTATAEGGGISVRNGTLVFRDSTLTRNEADSGAGLFGFFETNLNFNNSFITDNTANNEGGAVWISANSILRLLNGSVVSGNRSGVTPGGTGAGGGVYNEGGTANVVDSTISENSARGNGGGILSRVDSTTRITNSTISMNSAVFGGGFFNGGSSFITDSLIVSNQASNDGGGVLTNTNGSTTITGSNLNGNTPNDETRR